VLRLRCTLVLPGPVDVSAYQAEVLVEDVTRSDDAAVPIARSVVPARSLPRTGNRLGPAGLELAPPPGRERHAAPARLTAARPPAAASSVIARAAHGSAPRPLNTVRAR